MLHKTIEHLGRKTASIGATLAKTAIVSVALAMPAGGADGDTAPLRIILSTDVAAGLDDTSGGMSLVPVTFDATHGYTPDANFVPQDYDDALTLAAALNLDAAGMLEVLAVVPIFGNATMQAEMMVARHITQDLKGRSDIPIDGGALMPAAQILNPTATWYDGSTVKIEGENGSFAAACRNSGVDLMRDTLRDADGPVTVLAIGPVTDVACLLMTAPEPVLENVGEVIVLASQLEGDGTRLNGIPINDFNIRMDPIAAAMLLAADRVSVPLRFMSFQLTGQLTQADQAFTFDAATYPGPQPVTDAGTASFQWLLTATRPRAEYFTSIFGNAQGPFDQFTLMAAMRPDLFVCDTGFAYMQMCPYPAWSASYPADSNGNPTQQPYNAPGNPCVDHGGEYSASLSKVPAQLVITLDPDKRGSLVRGKTGVDGNLPSFGDMPARQVHVCTDFAGDEARTAFRDQLKQWTW